MESGLTTGHGQIGRIGSQCGIPDGVVLREIVPLGGSALGTGGQGAGCGENGDRPQA